MVTMFKLARMNQVVKFSWEKEIGFGGLKKAEVIEKIEDACGENLSLENLFTCKK